MSAHTCVELQPPGVCHRCDLNRDEIESGITEELVRELLEELGSTPDEVAASLRSIEMRGDEESAESCPIANYLRECLQLPTGDASVRNTVTRIEIVMWTPDSLREHLKIKTPRPVRKFTRRFDHGHKSYRDLRS